MATSWLSPAFYTWLSENSDLVPFIEIESFPQTLSDEEKEKKINEYQKIRENNIKDLLDFSTVSLVVTEPEIQVSSKPTYDSAKKAVYLYHLICYIQNEIYNQQLESFNSSLAKCSSIISLLQSNDISNNFNIKIDKGSLFKYLLVESQHTSCLRFKFQTIAREYEKNLSAKADLSILSSILDKTINTCVNQMDKQSSYFYPNNADQRVIQILLCSASPVAKEFEEIITTFDQYERKAFSDKVQQFALKVQQTFDVQGQFKASVLNILIIRVAFSLAYSNNPHFFYPSKDNRKLAEKQESSIYHISKKMAAKGNALNSGTANQESAPNDPNKDKAAHSENPNSILSESSSVSDDLFKKHNPYTITCEQICAETEMLKSDEIKKSIYDVFGSNDFQSSVMYVNFAFLHVNPIDALFEIHEAIGLAQRAISVRLGFDNTNILPFEQLFGPMIGVFLCSDVCRIEDLCAFVLDFSPRGVLCPELEFTLATVEALSKFINSFQS